MAGRQSSAFSQEDLRQAVVRAIKPIEQSMEGYREQRHCFSCHHHAHAIIALTELAHRGFDVDRSKLRIQFHRSVLQTERDVQKYLDGKNIGGGIDTAGHSMMALKFGGHRPDKTTDAIVSWMLDRAQKDGHWKGIEYRPPTQVSDFTRALLCVNAFRNFGRSPHDSKIEHQIANTKDWMLKTKVDTTEDKVSRLRLTKAIGTLNGKLTEYADDLISDQRNDGGWGPQTDFESDAYSTGSVLMALNEVGAIASNDPVFMRGVQLLMSTQHEDGTWHVKTRARAVQEYFETGFPHGKDQFISFTATCWAATAIALTFTEGESSDPLSQSNWTCFPNPINSHCRRNSIPVFG